MKNRIMGELKKVFRPEFLNRIDESSSSTSSPEEIKTIVELLLRRIRQSLAERELQLELAEEDQGPAGRARLGPRWAPAPLRRAIQRYIEDPLADRAALGAGPGRHGDGRQGAPTDGDEPDVALSVVAPAKVAAVGAPAEGETEEHRDEPPPTPAEGEGSEQS